ncbi:eukaryotic aspartyl protease [Colletotrichum orchidophilum]|uniref:Eukaryotic aspartyl protease n=1 Tax=Colletotrichum orchidophilum TaxID=1209926 RepID=A0A1G4ASD2_9PEZI|nr:eukaryotic aspartyl protease [Colletotrichum orchidophilum]OHE92074.1 eukaryotic aspartyl protease [Colletotrichum orchidophilum]
MALLSSALLALSLVTGTKAWPQLPTDGVNFSTLMTLPVIPYTAAQHHNVDVVPRGLSLPVDEGDGVNIMMTLPVTSKSRRKRCTHVPRKVLLDNLLGDDLEALPAAPVVKPPVLVRGLPVDDTVDANSAFVTLPVIHSTKRGVFSRQVEASLANRSDVAYYAQLNIGTPPQPVYAQVDTGSFELWVNPDCAALAASDQRFCEAVGFYDTARSSTAVSLQTTKTLRYGIGAANITYVRDSLAIAGSRTTMQQVQFGVATSSEDQFAGILGIGYGNGVNTRYKNLVDELATQGVTRTKAFSLGLGSKDEQEGAIVFGGIDTSKFSGPLARLPIIPADQAPDGVARYWVNMKSISLTPPSRRVRMYQNSSMPVFLDSGATLTLLPEELAIQVATDFGSPGLDANGFYSISCTLVGLNGTIDFDFDGIKIQVPYKEMIRELRTTPPTCYLGIVPNTDFTLLGDTFLRSAYAVFDLDTKTAYLAQYVNCGTRTMPISRPEDIAAIRGLCPPPAGSTAVLTPPEASDTTTSPGTGTGSGSASGSGVQSNLPTSPAPKMSGMPASGTISSTSTSAPSTFAIVLGIGLAVILM